MITVEEARVRLANIFKVMEITRERGEGRVSEDELEKIYGPIICKLQEIISEK